MSATGLKALLDPVEGLTAVFRAGEHLDEAEFPYATILDPLGSAPALSGDGRTLGRRRLAQVDLWQDRAGEDDDLLETVVSALDGAKAAGERFRYKVDDVALVDDSEADPDVIHHALTVSTVRLG